MTRFIKELKFTTRNNSRVVTVVDNVEEIEFIFSFQEEDIESKARWMWCGYLKKISDNYFKENPELLEDKNEPK